MIIRHVQGVPKNEVFSGKGVKASEPSQLGLSEPILRNCGVRSVTNSNERIKIFE